MYIKKVTYNIDYTVILECLWWFALTSVLYLIQIHIKEWCT